MTDTANAGTIKVTVLDEPFRIASEAEPGYTREVAAHVDRTLRALRDAAPTLEPFPTAVLGAMEITDNLFRARAEGAALVADVKGQIERIEALIAAMLEREPDLRESGRRAGKRSRKETSAR